MYSQTHAMFPLHLIENCHSPFFFADCVGLRDRNFGYNLKLRHPVDACSNLILGKSTPQMLFLLMGSWMLDAKLQTVSRRSLALSRGNLLWDSE
jgi:hypothetical protein